MSAVDFCKTQSAIAVCVMRATGNHKRLHSGTSAVTARDDHKATNGNHIWNEIFLSDLKHACRGDVFNHISSPAMPAATTHSVK